MQKPLPWLVGGLALTGLASMLSGLGEGGTMSLAQIELTLPGLIVGAAGQFCLWRGMRSGIATLWQGLWSGAARQAGTSAPGDQERPPRRVDPFEDEAPLSDFDADAVFARYMEKRAAQEPDMPSAPIAAAAGPAPSPRPAARPAFGRKGV
ncbi:MAG: hypothetical protein GC147_14040 [Porphyrobacter sp.]|nr:hypothetical protein [Porphyrobacter sp.]